MLGRHPLDQCVGLEGRGMPEGGDHRVGVAQDDLQAKYEKKVSEAWFTNNGFTDDYDVARERSKESGKPIFAYFTRSYAH